MFMSCIVEIYELGLAVMATIITTAATGDGAGLEIIFLDEIGKKHRLSK